MNNELDKALRMDIENASAEKWAGDLLERKQVADYLTNYLSSRYKRKPDEAGFVLALSADWGYGKTFLIENWAADLRSGKYPVVVFDAWANDFTSEPLIAFVSQIEKSLRPIVAEVPIALRSLDAAINKAKMLWRPTANVLMQIAAKKLTNCSAEQLQSMLYVEEGGLHKREESGSDEASKKMMKEIVSSLEKVYDASLKEHSDKQKAIKGFKESLRLLINEINEATQLRLPLFIFVDELDRCRPDYAIELLEGIKHLFGVAGVYFIVSVNMQQLAESTKSIYGANFAGHRYLKRFFDIEFALPEPNHELFAKSLFDNSALPLSGNFFTGLSDNNSGNEALSLSSLFAKYALFFDIGLRDQEQVVKVIEAASTNLKKIHAHWMFFLAILIQKDPSVFTQLVNSQGAFSHAEFRLLINSLQQRVIKFTSRDFGADPFSDGEKIKRTDLFEVIWVYYQFAWKNLVEIDGLFNSFDFPQNIITVIKEEAPNPWNRHVHYPSSLVKYPELIKYAGHFH